MNKIKIISENTITKIFINDKKIDGVIFLDLKQTPLDTPELHLVIKGDLDIQIDNSNVTFEKEEEIIEE